MGYYRSVYVETASDRFWSFLVKFIFFAALAAIALKVLIPLLVLWLVLRLIFG